MNRRRAFSSAVGAALTVATWRAAHRGAVGPREEQVFRRLNGAPDALHGPIWAVMQCGSLGAVWCCAALELRAGRRRRACTLAAVGTAVWGGVKLVKPFVGRGRPAEHLRDVRVRGRPQSGLGFPSGHAAVSTALGILATAGSDPRARRGAWAVAATVGFSRIYVGAHLPLDVVGGFGIGMLAGNVGVGLLVPEHRGLRASARRG